MRKKRAKIFILISFTIILIVLTCNFFRKHTVNELVANSEEIDYIFYMNGNTGDITEVREYKAIQDIKEFFASIHCRRRIDIIDKLSGGFSYAFTLVDKVGNEQKIMFVGNKVKVNGKYYSIVDKSVDVETFIETLNQ